MTLVVACGLKREARIIERWGCDVSVVIGGGVADRLASDLDDMIEIFPGIVLSAGVAGALAPTLAAGDVVIDGDPAIVRLLRLALPTATIGKVVGSGSIIASVAEKHALASTGAVAVDMESHVALEVARARDLPFGVVRTISDAANEALPPAALVGMRHDGGVAIGAIMRSIASNPRQLPALIATGRNAGRAFRSLARVFDALYAADFDRIDIPTLPAD